MIPAPQKLEQLLKENGLIITHATPSITLMADGGFVCQKPTFIVSYSQESVKKQPKLKGDKK